MRILKAGGLYFAIVFGAGFVLGTIRTLWVLPRLGVRTAELLEMPLMLGVMIVACKWAVGYLALPFVVLERLAVGLVGLGLLLLSEFGFMLWLRNMTVAQYWASRDPVSGTVYLVLLGIFAIMPVCVARHRAP